MIVYIKIVGKVVRSFWKLYMTKLQSYDCNAWIKNFTEITSLIPKDIRHEILTAFGCETARRVPSRPKRFERVETGLSKYTSLACSFPIIYNEIIKLSRYCLSSPDNDWNIIEKNDKRVNYNSSLFLCCFHDQYFRFACCYNNIDNLLS